MGAREKLRGCFPALPEGASNQLIEDAVTEILNDHAHELAETQRDLMRSGILSIETIIDSIDPEAP